MASLAIAGALSGCGDPINNSGQFAQWNAEQINAITTAHTIPELIKVPDLEKNIRKWVTSPYNTWDMKVMQTIKGGIAGVEQNSILSITFGEVREGTFFARFTNPRNPNEFKDFAILCANGLLNRMNNLSFSTPVPMPKNQPQEIVITRGLPSLGTPYVPNIVTIPQGGSLMGTLALTENESRDVADRYNLPSFRNQQGQYVVTVQPGMQFDVRTDMFNDRSDGTSGKTADLVKTQR